MEVWTGVSQVSVVLYVCTLLWKRQQILDVLHRCDLTCAFLIGPLIGPLVAALCCTESPDSYSGAVCGGCCCSVGLICIIARKQKLLPVQNRAVLVTGCDSGFGQALVQQLSRMGLKVFAGVLDVNGVGAQRLRELRRENLQLLQLDITDAAQVEAALQHVQTQVSDSGLWGLVNNAGVLQCPVDAELQPLAAFRRCMDVNFLSAVHMCQLFLPLLRRAAGRIVNVSSLAAEVPMPMFGAYGASKAALKVVSEVMRQELAPWGVRVSVIQPAGFRTNIFGDEDSVRRHAAQLLATVSAEARADYGDSYISSLSGGLAIMSRQAAADLSPVVDDMCDALLSANPRALYAPGQMGWLLPFLHRTCSTTVFDAIISHLPKYTNQQPAGLRRM
ncbi:17-beta-hydroxysteroid dehydrogenase type 2 [Stegastes partitus]|uniref:17-beta-hydroxysteroid dehydrogenase type 2 n=1 Tax=Stegastes partitus TaxID=144197 RepID=A0A9Y4NC13_9TELE|nr:PREDICTED: estradiol 17-beta-dehydrogenase 2 [Stegastes partitus]